MESLTSAGCEDPEDEEEEEGDGEENDDEGGGSLAQAAGDTLHLRGHGGDGARRGRGGGRHDAAAVVCLHHRPHLALALYHLDTAAVMRCPDVMDPYITIKCLA